MSEKNSYRQILYSSFVIGGASVINIVIGLARTKAAAVLLGPAGVGVIGLLQSLMTTASAVSALGFGTVGTRQIAEAAGTGDDAAVAAARRALFWGSMGLAIAGAAGFWFLRDLLAVQVLRDPAYAPSLGWLAIGVALSVVAGSQTALLNGLRRIGDLAWLSITAGLLSAVLGVGALLWSKDAGVLFFVIAAPASSVLLGHWFVNRLRLAQPAPTPLAQLGRQWRTMIRLGAAFMVSGLVVTVGQLAVRLLVQRELGPAALGQFQAAWAISMTYIGFVLFAMGTDYYPRLTSVINDHETVNRLVNEQTEVAMLLSGPVFLVVLGLAPWVIQLLYSSAFDEAIPILRWQILGDVLKVVSWPLGFIILAAGDGRAFMFSESVAMGVFVFFAWIGLPVIGVQATGIGFLVMYVVYLPLVFWLARRRTGFRPSRRVVGLLLNVAGGAGTVAVTSAISEIAGGLLGLLLGAGLGLYGFARLGAAANFSGRVGKVAGWVRHMLLRVGVFRD